MSSVLQNSEIEPRAITAGDDARADWEPKPSFDES